MDAYEEKVRQRKERLEQWRREREAQKAQEEMTAAEAEGVSTSRKSWNLNDDEEDDDDGKSEDTRS